MNVGISAHEFTESIKLFNEAIKELVELYLTEEERKELNNHKTKKRRIKELVRISGQRMELEFAKEE